MCFWRGHRNSGFFSDFTGIFRRNSCGQEFLYLLGIPEDSGGFLFPPKTVWLRPATKEGTLLSKIWTKIDIFNLSPNRRPWCPLPPSSAGASWPEGEGCRRGRYGTGRGGCIDGGSAGGCPVGNDNCNCNGRCRQQQTTNNNQQQARGKAVSGDGNDRGGIVGSGGNRGSGWDDGNRGGSCRGGG